ncbi:hypothetical protein [Histophilus somni]|uniref:hypothetical protein n=1 Tax=Histophilus somni TaxID=731 RepID=UPI00201F4825|nr:hypothetical protein [Histophilus somni]
MKTFFEYDFKTTLINRAEIEKVLGISIPNKEKQDGHRAVKIDQTKAYDNEDINQVVTAKDEQIAELEKQLEQAKRAESAVKSDDVLTQPKQGRISQPQRDLFSPTSVKKLSRLSKQKRIICSNKCGYESIWN